jgi:hypothetical protein
MGSKVKYINNCETGEVIVREMTAEEIELEAKEAKIFAEKAAQIEAEKAQTAAYKAALLDRLGITAEEAKLLLS